MTELVKYEEARRLLAEAVAVDEVKLIRDQAVALAAYARQAKDREIEVAAAQIRFRAEQRLGEMIIAQKETVGLAKGGQPYRNPTCSDKEQVGTPVPTLEQAGIDRKLSSRAQRMARLPEDKFEELLERHADEVRSGVRVTMDLLKVGEEADGRERRRALQQALSDETAKLPMGRRFPVVYADPPWHRKQGVTGRSYENHYPTMTWDDICALPVRDLLLPDAWVFLWIPRAHMFALHTVDMEFATDDGCVITRKVQMPLAWAVARAWGCDSYSTAFVWTKTDEEHPEDQGGGVITFDQDEILLLFKRGRGLPKPDTKEKFGSNHRERSKPLGHSRKPEFYRQMIATMCGGLPVMELFARVDAENPLPENWHAWGNEAPAQDSLAKADAEIAATEGAQAPAAEGVNSAASRLAGGRTPAPAEDDVVAASSSADQFFGEDERTIWKALSALDAGVTIEGPILEALVHDGLIMTGAVDCGYLVTTHGLSTLGMYDAYFNPPVDGLSTDELQALNGIPGEGASGTAREAPSAGSGDVDLQSASGTQSAPPQDSPDTDTPGCTALSEGNATTLPVAASVISAPTDPVDVTADAVDEFADTIDSVAPELAGASAEAAPPAPDSEPDEFTILKAFSSFATPDRFTIIGPVAADYIARGLVFKYGGVTDWGLTAAGYDRLDELKRERAGLAPKVLTPPAVSDLSDDERDMREVLAAIAGAYRSDLSVTARTAYERDLIGLGFLSVIDDCGGLAVTEAGHAWLRETEATNAPAPLTQPEPLTPVQINMFGAAR